METVVVAALFHGEHGGTVGTGSLAVLNGGGGLVDGGTGCIIVLRSQNSLGILIVDDHLVAGVGETGGGLVGAAAIYYQVELLGKQGFVSGADGFLGAEIALVGIPLEGVAPNGILDVEAALGSSGGDGPLGIHIIQRDAGEAGTHGELLIVGGGKGILAVLDTQGPQLGIAVAGELIGGIQGHIHTGTVISGYRCGGHGLFDRGVEYDHLVAVLQGGQVCDDAALPGGRNLQTIDAGKQHSRVGSGGVIHEPGAIDIV